MKVSILDISKEDYSFSKSDYSGKILPNNVSLIPLSKLMASDPQKGVEFGSKSYVDKRFYNSIPFIKISDIWDGLYCFNCSRDTELAIPSKTSKFLNKGDFVIQTASKNLGKISVYGGETKVAYNSHLRIVRFTKYSYYLLAFFNSKLGLNQFIQRGSIQGVDNFSKKTFDKILVPIPDTSSVDRISLLAQRIVEIERRMLEIRKDINKIFDSFVDLSGEELLSNYRETTVTTIKELKNKPWNFREHSFDFKNVVSAIKKKSIEEEEYLPLEKIRGGNTPKQRFLGDSKDYPTHWVTPTDFDDFGYIKQSQTIASPKLKTITKPTLLIVNRTSRGQGEYVGIAGFLDGETPAHNNQGVYCYDDSTKDHLVYLTALINSDIYRFLFQSIGKGSKMREIRATDIAQLPMLKIKPELENKIISLMTNKDCNGYLDLSKEHQKLVEEIDNYFSTEIFEEG